MVLIPKLATLSHREIASENGFPRYSAQEMERRYSALRAMMDEHSLDVLLIGGVSGGLETTVQYFSNWAPLVESFIVVPRDEEPVLFARLWNHLPDAGLVSTISDVRYGGDTFSEQAGSIASFLKQLGVTAQGIGWLGTISAGSMLSFQRDLSGARWTDLNSSYSALRAIKSDEEIAYIRVASEYNDLSVAAMRDGIHPGMAEYEICRLIESEYLDRRGVNLIHFTLSTPMSDPQVCVPHQQQPDRIIQAGDVIVTEISTMFWGYAGQILRSFTVGEDPTSLYDDLYSVGAQAYENITGILRDGVTVGEILDASNVIHEAGFTILDDLVHGQGGAYLPPIIRTRQTRGATHPDDYVYRAGSVIVVQPNVVTPNFRAGIQVGNALRITEDGAEILQEFPMEFIRCS